ncbi:hypothetical protein J3R80_06615 [Aliiroseovarius sp. Z3]|uniref:hypothetical protein n=1 Tax=Aliiroseovarius sp. Z3 TaxID=2811402 RepID=UPI0023B2B637|nr:hypothetical protein [Aliiroseovarius sp. Z3]MDE9450139.1 hypothetical protein [Aliiroseovarius sp. Z3]
MIGLISMVITAWIAVAWHRYVLMNEAPRGWIPTFHGSNIINYVIWALVLTVTYVLFLAPVGVIAFGWLFPEISQPGGTPDAGPGQVALIAIVFLICFLAAIVVLARFSPVLVSRALGQRLGLSEAWKATQGSSKAIIGLFFWSFLIGFVVMFCLSFILALLGGVAGLIMLPFMIIAQWFLSIVSISVVTTIYGHYVEGRELSLQ